MRVEVHHVGAEIAGPRDAQNGVHVGAVEIDQSAGVVHQLGDVADLPVEHAQRVGVGDHEHGRLLVELRAARSSRSTNPAGVLLTVTASKPAMRGAGRIGAVGTVGSQHLACAFRRDRGSRPPPPAAPSVRPARRRPVAAKRHGSPEISASICCSSYSNSQHALQRVVGLIGMQIGEPGQAGQPLVPLGVVLHRTRAQRIEMRVDRHV